MGATFTRLVGDRLGLITGQHFCLIYWQGQYAAVLDLRSGDAIAEIKTWFQRNLGEYDYDTCSLVSQLRLITLRDDPVGHPIDLCNPGTPTKPEDKPEEGGEYYFIWLQGTRVSQETSVPSIV
ncbi:MAG: hypothetical protein Q8O75_02835 [bacterium]|nr:hypothetical protein [bacterium]